MRWCRSDWPGLCFNPCLWGFTSDRKKTEFFDKTSKIIDILPVFFEPKWSLTCLFQANWTDSGCSRVVVIKPCVLSANSCVLNFPILLPHLPCLGDQAVVGLFKGRLGPVFVFVFLSFGFCLVLALVAHVCYCLFFVFCLEFQMIRFVISTFSPIFFIEISFVLLPPPPVREAMKTPQLTSPRSASQVRHKLFCQHPFLRLVDFILAPYWYFGVYCLIDGVMIVLDYNALFFSFICSYFSLKFPSFYRLFQPPPPQSHSHWFATVWLLIVFWGLCFSFYQIKNSIDSPPRLAWALFVLLLPTLLCCQPTELILGLLFHISYPILIGGFFFFFINFPIFPPPPPRR